LLDLDRFKSLDSIIDSGSIVSHVNNHNAGKTDIGSAFAWRRLSQSRLQQL